MVIVFWFEHPYFFKYLYKSVDGKLMGDELIGVEYEGFRVKTERESKKYYNTPIIIGSMII